jgi:hypothetical protein
VVGEKFDFCPDEVKIVPTLPKRQGEITQKRKNAKV